MERRLPLLACGGAVRSALPSMEMSDEIEALLAAALRLSREERAQLAVLLTDYVEDAPSEEIERAWLSEAKRRLEEVRAGRMRTIPAEEVERKLWDMLERGRLRAAAAG